MKKSRVIGVISIKGGVGKTTTVSNLGAILANDFKKRVLLVDANYTAPNLGIHLGVLDPKFTIHEVLLGHVDVQQAVLKHAQGFDVIPASVVSNKIVNPYKLKETLNHLKGQYDIMLLDSSPNLNEEVLSTIIASDELLVVTTPDHPTMSCTLNAVKVAKQKKTPISGIIINRVHNKKFELGLEYVEQQTHTPVVSVIPYDLKMLESVAYATPAALSFKNSDAVIEYKKLAAALIGEEYKDPRFAQWFKQLFNTTPTKDAFNRGQLYSQATPSSV